MALDTIETPETISREQLGGSATYFAFAARPLCAVAMVAVVGEDFPVGERNRLTRAGIDLDGLQIAPGRTFRWSGRYGDDPNERTTLDTQLNVFAGFQPQLPEHYRDADLVFLGNIDPALQLDVLEQVRGPRLVACDTMNFWIERECEALKRTLSRVDVLIVNDEEVRLLSGSRGLLKGARQILDLGPRALVVKKGEHGAMLVTRDEIFVAPAIPLERVIDPTGAGDSFAGAFMAYLSQQKTLNSAAYRRAIVHGTVAASFCVEQFGIAGLEGLDHQTLGSRLDHFRSVTRWEE